MCGELLTYVLTKVRLQRICLATPLHKRMFGEYRTAGHHVPGPTQSSLGDVAFVCFIVGYWMSLKKWNRNPHNKDWEVFFEFFLENKDGQGGEDGSTAALLH